jgi:hypothetical protein
VEAKLGIEGYCASDFPVAAFKIALRSQLGFGTVTVTSVMDQSTLCGARRLSGSGRNLAGISTTAKKVKVAYAVQLVVETEKDQVVSGIASFADTTTGALAALSSEFSDEITLTGDAPALGLAMPADEVETAVSVVVTYSPTMAPTKYEVSSMEGDGGGINGGMIAGIVAVVFVLVGLIGVQTTQNVPKKVEKVYNAGDEGDAPPTNPTTTQPSTREAHPVPSTTEVQPVYPAVEEEAASVSIVRAPTRPTQTGSPVEITLSPTATRGPPCDLFIDGMPED